MKLGMKTFFALLPSGSLISNNTRKGWIEKQMVAVKTNCGSLLTKFSDRAFILNDESYLMFTLSTFNNNDGYYTSDVSMTQPILKFITKAKFKDMIFIWIAMGLIATVIHSSTSLGLLSISKDIWNSAFVIVSSSTSITITTMKIMSSG